MKHWGRISALNSQPAGWNNQKFQYMLRLGGIGTIIAGAAIQLRALASGKNPENMADPAFAGAAILRGGGLGYYGDFLYDQANAYDNHLIPALMGPVASDIEAIWNVTGVAAFKKGKGERIDEGANLLRIARGNIPFLNLWYTKAAADHLIWNNIQEMSNPGYLDRMMDKAYNRKGTTWYWDPHESLPSVPNMSEAWQPEKAADSTGRWIDKVMR